MSLTGTYGGYITAGVDYAFIAMTVGGAELNSESNVLVWAEINDIEDNTGNKEGFYCMAKYTKD